MNMFTEHIGRPFTRILLLALIALALFPPGPTRSVARAAPDDPPPVPAGLFQLFLPVIGNAAAPDLIFTPDTVELDPGAQASVQVQVEPAADLRGASFDIPGVQDGVTSSFEAAADGQSGTLTISASTALSDGESRALQVHGTSGDGSNGWVGRLKIKTKPAAGATTLFVDPVKGKDSNDGTQAKPLKTLTKALSKAKKGDTVQLARGVYNRASNGERFTDNGLLVPGGVTIIGTPAHTGDDDGSVLEGAQTDDGLVFAGDATVTNLQLGGFREAIFANQGKQTFRNLALDNNVASLVLDNIAQSTLTGSTIGLFDHPGVVILGQAKFTMDGGVIANTGPACNIDIGIGMNDSGQATLKNGVSIENLQTALQMSGNSRATLTGTIMKRALPSACGGDPMINLLIGAPALTLQNSQIINSGGASPIGIGIDSNTAASLTLIGTTLRDFKGGTGILLNSTTKLVLSGGSRITGNKVGIDARGNPNGSVTILNSELSGNSLGINTPILKLRNSRVAGNGSGILIAGVNGFALADLGQASDPGGNTLSGNTLSGLTFGANVIQGGALARGNSWNLSTQGTDAAGHYTDGRVINGRDPLARGKNFDLPNVNLVIEL